MGTLTKRLAVLDADKRAVPGAAEWQEGGDSGTALHSDLRSVAERQVDELDTDRTVAGGRP